MMTRHGAATLDGPFQDRCIINFAPDRLGHGLTGSSEHCVLKANVGYRFKS
jgi:hypothetical protein